MEAVKHYECQPMVWHETPLIFDWNEESGVVSGRDAYRILAAVSDGEVNAHPMPWSWILSDAPLKNKTDMAAIIGRNHLLPDDLADFYPRCANDVPDGAIC